MPDFLSSFFGQGGGAQSAVSSFLNPIASAAGNSLTQALFGRQDRISNRDYQFYQDLADSGNPREIARQNEFLEGVTPTNIAQYNAYQDGTYQQDTDRQLDRIGDIGKATRMSPWELAGVGGATPLPSPDFGTSQGTGGGQTAQFLSQLTPLKIAEMNNQTQLATTAMNNQTAKDINSQNTAGGELPKTQNDKLRQDIQASMQGMSESQTRQTVMAADIVLKAAQTTNTQQQTAESQTRIPNIEAGTKYLEQQKTESEARTLNTQQQTRNLEQTFDIESIRKQLNENEDLRKSIQTLAAIAPRETWQGPGYTRSEIPKGGSLVRLAQALTTKSATGSDATNNPFTLWDMSDVELSDAMKAALAAGQIIKETAEFGAKKSLMGSQENLNYSKAGELERRGLD